MPRQNYDPLSHIPSSTAISQALHEAEAKAERLRLLLRVAREIEATDRPAASAEEEAVRAS